MKKTSPRLSPKSPHVGPYFHVPRRLGVHPYFKVRSLEPHDNAKGNTWSVPKLCEAYDWPTNLPGGGLIAIVELGGGWVPADMDQYFQSIGQVPPIITDISVDGTENKPDPRPNSADSEVALDIQIAAAAYYLATGHPATIRIYWAADIAMAVRAATADGCDVCSISWGSDEANWRTQGSTALADDMELAAKQATEAGMIVFAASGDNDSSDGGPSPANVDLPASAPHVIGCGGTTKTTIIETVWNNSPGNTNGQGTGGGFSTIFPMPSWQAGAPNGPGRMVPDVAANADPNTGYEIFLHGKPTVLGGTSAVAPLYAGLFASFGTKLGFVTPELWLNHLCFNDITEGDNGSFRARIGPDACTGLGSPIGSKLAQLLGHPVASAARRLRLVSAENERLVSLVAAAKATAGNALGCCTIEYDDRAEDQIPGITQAKCRQLADARSGTAQWTPGACAET